MTRFSAARPWARQRRPRRGRRRLRSDRTALLGPRRRGGLHPAHQPAVQQVAARVGGRPRSFARKWWPRSRRWPTSRQRSAPGPAGSAAGGWGAGALSGRVVRARAGGPAGRGLFASQKSDAFPAPWTGCLSGVWPVARRVSAGLLLRVDPGSIHAGGTNAILPPPPGPAQDPPDRLGRDWQAGDCARPSGWPVCSSSTWWTRSPSATDASGCVLRLPIVLSRPVPRRYSPTRV